MCCNLISKASDCLTPTTGNSYNVQSSIAFIPDEISIRIFGNLRKRDILTCRIVSSVMREKIDRLFCDQFCVTLTQNEVNELNEKPKLNPRFRKMRLLDTLFSSTKLYKLRKEYFECITDLELSGAMSPAFFHQILKITPHLQVLRLNSATLGGTSNLFDGDAPNGIKLGRISSINNMMPAFLLKTFRSKLKNLWEKLHELHIKIDYIMPSKTFSPLNLVKNLHALNQISIPKLSVFTCKIEETDQKEMFYFTLSSLLKIIPTMTYASLKFVSIIVPKCRPENKCFNSSQSYETPRSSNRLPLLQQLQLSNLNLQIGSGFHNPLPIELLDMLRGQKKLERLTIGGMKDVTLLNIIDEIVYQNKTSLKMLCLL